MMDAIRQYALTLISTALICGILLQLFPTGISGKLLRLVCSSVMLTVFLSPVCRMEFPNFDEFLADFSVAGEEAAQTGAEMAEAERRQLIKAGLEAYVLDKAYEMGCQVTVDVSLDSDGIPCDVRLAGDLTDEQYKRFAAMVSNDLGIPEEDQQWNLQKQRN